MHFTQYHDRAWGLIQTKPNFEKPTRKYVENIGLPCYLPLLREVKSKYRTSYLPMFRNYLFAAWNINDRRSLAMCKNIINRIETPPGCDSEIIEQMEFLYKLEQLSEVYDVNLRTALRLPKRQLEKIKSGPLAGFTGYWKELNGQKIFAITMNMLDNKLEATIGGAELTCE